MCFWAVWWWSGAGGNCDDGGPLWTNGQHGYKIDCLNIMYYNCAGVEWSSDPPTNRRFFEVVPQKVKRRFSLFFQKQLSVTFLRPLIDSHIKQTDVKSHVYVYDLLTNSVIILSNLASLSFGEGSDWVQS